MSKNRRQLGWTKEEIIEAIRNFYDKNGRIPDHIDYISGLIKKAVGVELIKD